MYYAVIALSINLFAPEEAMRDSSTHTKLRFRALSASTRADRTTMISPGAGAFNVKTCTGSF